MLETLVLGVAASFVSEAITWVNARLSGTVLKGDGAWIVAGVVALVASLFKVFYLDGASVPHDLPTLFTDLGLIWAVSQVFFVWVVSRFNLDVKTQ